MKYFVWNPKAAMPKVAHDTLADAVRESERLAKNHHGQEFYVMGPLGVSKVERPSIYRSFDIDMPF